MAFIIEFGNYWLTDVDPLLGDPARTVVKDAAKRFKTEKSANKALIKVTENNFHRFKGKICGKVVEIE